MLNAEEISGLIESKIKNMYNRLNIKVRHHNHFTGEYIDTVCKECNFKIQTREDQLFMPVFFHNLNYDKNVFIKSIYKCDKIKNISIVPSNKNKFKSFNFGKYHFVDTYAHMPESLEKLINNLSPEQKIFLKSLDITEFNY